MQPLRNHIVLLGFKHVGKSIIGKNLARTLRVPFIDLDNKIESLYETKFNKKAACRQIMEELGEKGFRHLEITALSDVIAAEPSIISLGGGTPMHAENQRLIKTCIPIHITAPQGVVFERILLSGRPAFFDPKESLLDSFNRLWNERIEIYDELKYFSIENTSTVDEAISKIIRKLNLEEEKS